MNALRSVSLLALASCALAAQAGTLSTGTLPNNGLGEPGGLFLDLTNLTASSLLTVTSFDTYATGSAGTPSSFDVYTRAGSYVGFDGSSAGWTLATTASGTSAGPTVLEALTLASGLSVGAGQTLGVYLVSNSGGIAYNDSSATSFSNSDLGLFSDLVRTKPFGGASISPRTFAGNVNYTLSPTAAPGPAAALAFGVGLVRRRRKRA